MSRLLNSVYFPIYYLFSSKNVGVKKLILTFSSPAGLGGLSKRVTVDCSKLRAKVLPFVSPIDRMNTFTFMGFNLIKIGKSRFELKNRRERQTHSLPPPPPPSASICEKGKVAFIGKVVGRSNF